MCIRLLCTYYSVYVPTFVHIIFYTHRRRRRSVAGSTRAIGVMKYRGPSRDVLVFFFSASLIFIVIILPHNPFAATAAAREVVRRTTKETLRDSISSERVRAI